MREHSFDKILLPVIAAIVAVMAIFLLLLPHILPQDKQAGSNASAAVQLSEDGSAIVIDKGILSTSASYFDFVVDDITVELFAVEASDGTIRLALNTCQVCNGSPYAYFVQEEDAFICQNCFNRFASVQVGLVDGGCNPVPVTSEYYSVENNSILVSTEFLAANAVRFQNWKKF